MLLARMFLAFSMCVLLISCADEIEEQKGQPIAAASPAPASSLEQNSAEVDALPENYFKATIEENPQPNSYRLRISWEPFAGTVYLYKDNKVLSTSLADSGQLEIDQEGGANGDFKIEVRREGSLRPETQSVQVEIPQDFVLSGQVLLTENLKIEAARVFISSGTLITTENYSLTISAESLIAEGAVIRNYPLNAKAPREQHGRSGGAISLVAKKASGSLVVTLNGEDGGDGKVGVFAKPMIDLSTCVGTSGGNGGHAGNLSASFQDGSSLQLSSENIPGKAGKAGPKGQPIGTDVQNYIMAPCNLNAPEGVDGRAGIAGLVCVKKSSEMPVYCR